MCIRMVCLVAVLAIGLVILVSSETVPEPIDAVYSDRNPAHIPPLVAQVPAITSTRYDWHEWSGHTEKFWTVPTLKARGCRGEYVPLTFLTLGGAARTNFMVTAEPFHNDDFTFPDAQRTQGFEQPCTDIRWVKWWWQSGTKHYGNNFSVWTPELLLHDFDLVSSVYNIPNVNTLRDGDLPQDAATLQPMTIPAYKGGYQQQVWMTVYIPREAPPGAYEGSVIISSDEAPDLTVPIRLYVWPFELVPPRIDYSIYYRAKLLIDKDHVYRSYLEDDYPPEKFVGSEIRTMKQMKADLANMARHGVTNPTMTVPPVKSMLPVLAARRSVGCDNTRIFSQACGVGQQVLTHPEIPFSLGKLRSFETWAETSSRGYLRFLRRYGVQEFGRYGSDEGNLDDIRKQMPLWKAARKGGAFMYVAINVPGMEDVIEDSLSAAVISCSPGWPTPELVNKIHGLGTEIYVYGNPQCGWEDPVIYRQAQGLRMMASGVDGSMDYAWQHPFPAGHGAAAWDDFASHGSGTYRSHMMTYPGTRTPVDTLQWEGFAAGITDAGYLTTLEAEIDAAPEDCPVADEAQEFITRVYAEVNITDLEAMRLECAQWIVKLQEA